MPRTRNLPKARPAAHIRLITMTACTAEVESRVCSNQLFMAERCLGLRWWLLDVELRRPYRRALRRAKVIRTEHPRPISPYFFAYEAVLALTEWEVNDFQCLRRCSRLRQAFPAAVWRRSRCQAGRQAGRQAAIPPARRTDRSVCAAAAKPAVRQSSRPAERRRVATRSRKP